METNTLYDIEYRVRRRPTGAKVWVAAQGQCNPDAGRNRSSGSPALCKT